jgi:outer membrane cobalamin receptor
MTAPRRRELLRTTALAISLTLTARVSAHAQLSCSARGERSDSVSINQRWPSPLDRRVSLTQRNIVLRDALDRIATQARLRLSYVAELLPLDRTVCGVYAAAPAGTVLSELLRDVGLEPVVAGVDQVVLTPSRPVPSRKPAPLPETSARSVGVLDRIVVTGNTVDARERSSPVAIDVINGAELSQRGASTMSSALDGAVPGLWLWTQAPSSLLARYGSIRGASSFGISAPKIYIDGIEVANPLLITQLDPASIARVEVIRGPQGAALYGADAISGVINIVSRHDGATANAWREEFHTEAGTSRSAFSTSAVLAQTHQLALRSGSGTRTAGLSMSASTFGGFVPGAYARQLMATGNVRLTGSRRIVTGTARFFGENAGTATSPLLSGLTVTVPSFTDRGSGMAAGRVRATDSLAVRVTADTTTRSFTKPDSIDTQSVREYTLGASAMFLQNERWTHSLVLGVDGYHLADSSSLGLPFRSATDSALRAARGSAERGTVRLSSIGQLGSLGPATGTVTFAAEQSTVREQTESADLAPPAKPGQPDSVGTSRLVQWRNTTGLVTQLNGTLSDAVFVTAGLRLERNSTLTGSSQFAALPLLGASVVRGFGDATLKLRAAYGKAIRPARISARTITATGMRDVQARTDLSPEEQAGTEIGTDLFLGRRFALHVTRFDQRASGLIQPVAIVAETPSSGVPPRVDYQLQNVGEIANRGWELESSVGAGPLWLSGTLSLVESRVLRLASGYTGDLRPGDRMLGIPARTMSLTASWSAARWSTSWTASRASDWINYDEVALAEAFANSNRSVHDLVGAQLRTYWRPYDGVTRLRATLSRDLRRGLAFVVTGENLLDHQKGEPDNVTILPGRTVTAGVRARF